MRNNFSCILEIASFDNTTTISITEYMGNIDNDPKERASIASNLGNFDQFSHNSTSIYENIIRKIGNIWYFME